VMVLDKGVIMLAAKAPKGVSTVPGMEGWAPLMLEGFGGPAAEGAHIAVSAIDIKEDSLDMFLRFLLAHLIHFRGLVGHPGFWLNQGQPMMTLSYLTSITHEQDPVLQAEKLRRYEEQVRADFARHPVSPKERPAESREPPPAAEAPAVIHLPPPIDR
jgi:hypothetical protein